MKKKDNKDNQDKKSKKGLRERKPNWQEAYATVEDIQRFLDDRVMLRHNVVTGRVECHLPTRDLWEDWDGSAESTRRLLLSASDGHGQTRTEDGIRGNPCQSVAEYVPITDRVVNSLWAEMSRDKPVRIQDMHRVIESDYVPEYDPFRFYLDRLPRWNGRDDYIMELSLSVSVRRDADEQILFYQYLKKWLVGMVAAWVDESVVNNVILILIGEQGSYKTTWFNYLLPPELRQYFYTKTNSGRMGRDDLLTLAQYGLVCCEELDTMRPSELNQLKAAVTMPSIDERAAYAHFHEHRRHIASFCGTGNNAQFLSDPTGNRRWLPFEVQSIENPRASPFNYEGIYSQAYALYRQGFQYWFSQVEIQQLNHHNRQFETPRMEAELVDVYFRRPVAGEQGEFMPVSRALQIIGAGMTQKLSAVLLGRAFSEQGFEQVRRPHARGYIVVQRDAAEIKTRQRMLASGMTDDG